MPVRSSRSTSAGPVAVEAAAGAASAAARRGGLGARRRCRGRCARTLGRSRGRAERSRRDGRAAAGASRERQHAQQRHREARELVGRERQVAAAEHRDLVHHLHAARVEALRHGRHARRVGSSSSRLGARLRERHAMQDRGELLERGIERDAALPRCARPRAIVPAPSPRAMRSSSGHTRSPPSEPSISATCAAATLPPPWAIAWSSRLRLSRRLPAAALASWRQRRLLERDALGRRARASGGPRSAAA